MESAPTFLFAPSGANSTFFIIYYFLFLICLPPVPGSAVAPSIEHRACASVAEHLEQDRVRDAAINDDGLVDALIDGVGHALDLGQHTARNDARGLVTLDLGDVYKRQAFVLA